MAQMNNNKKQMICYFDTEITKYGENFLSKKTDTDLYNDSIKIIRDLVRSKINLDKYVSYLNEDRIKHVLIHVCNIKLNEACLVESSLKLYISTNTIPGHSIDEFASHVLDKYMRIKTGYEIILYNLNNFYNSNNTGYLVTLSNQVKAFKQYI